MLAFPKNHDDNLRFPESSWLYIIYDVSFMSKFPLTSLVQKLSTKIAHLQIRAPCGHDPITIIPKSPYDHVLLVVQSARCVLPSQRYSIVAVKTKAALLCRSPSSSCNFIGQAGCKMSVWRSADLGRFVDGWGTDSGTSIWFSQAVPHRRSALRSRDPPSSASRACAKDWGTHHANKWHIQAYPIHCLLNSLDTSLRGWTAQILIFCQPGFAWNKEISCTTWAIFWGIPSGNVPTIHPKNVSIYFSTILYHVRAKIQPRMLKHQFPAIQPSQNCLQTSRFGCMSWYRAPLLGWSHLS